MKILNVFTACVLFAMQLQAQEKGQVELGLGIGSNSSTINIENGNFGNDLDYTSGTYFAFQAEYFFSDRWGIKARLISDPKGFDYSYLYLDTEGQPQQFSQEVKINYLTIPVMMNWHFGKQRGWYLNFGLFMGILLNGDDIDDEDIYNQNEYRKIDPGFTFGLGHKFRLTDNLKLFVEMDFQDSFSSIYKSSYTFHATSFRGSLNAGVSYLIPLSATKE